MLVNSIRLNLESTVEQCWELIDKEIEDFLENPENLSMDNQILDDLLARNTLECREIDLFRFLVKWGKKREDSYTKNLLELEHLYSLKDIVEPYLHHIRFPLMNFKELIREVRPLGLIEDSEYIQSLEFNGDKEFILSQESNESQILFQKRKCKEDYFLSGPNYTLSKDNTVVTKSSSNSWDATCIGSLLIKRGIHKWSLKILIL